MNRPRSNKNSNVKQGIRITPFFVIAVFLILFFIGIVMDEPTRVFKQATQICLSCIGIG